MAGWHLHKLGLPRTHHFLESNNMAQVGSDPWIRSDPLGLDLFPDLDLFPGSGSATNMGK